jgi:hypothetical protein
MLLCSSGQGEWHIVALSTWCSARLKVRYIVTSGQGVRQGYPMGPLIFSLGINSLLRDLASTFGQTDSSRLTSKASILSPDDLALEQTLHYFDERRPFIRLSPAKCKMLAADEIQTNGLMMLGTCVEETPAPPASRGRTSTHPD